MALRDQLRVLVVDDTSVSRALICDALDQIGMKNVSIARDGEEGLHAMIAKPSHLVISDLNMPKLDGLGLLRAVRECEPIKKAAFILVTGRGDNAVVAQGRKYGLNNLLAKPFTVDSLRTSIEAVVGRLG
ncbi:response regulator [Methylocapsa sp. S129]|uniref:response regulator n=1 Tax=Methylocapsa sp. S129 TaxID=1641869 RepID=UPI00131A7CF1|nr:response regulator [Methylocapsa sp. S129]